MTKGRWWRVAREVAVWLLSAMLVFVFARAGIAKFDSGSGWAVAFAHWGYAPWFRVAIGVAEATAALLLLTPFTAAYGALIIIAVMLGGMGTHIVDGHPAQVTSELGQLTFATLVLLARWRSRLRVTRDGIMRAQPAR